MTLRLSFLLLTSFILMAFGDKKKTPPATIQVAIALDTSTSMDGLLEQSRRHIWKFIRHIHQYQKDGQAPIIEIALLEFGHAKLPKEEGFIRIVSPFTTNLSYLTTQLNKLEASGREENCGWLIRTSLDELNWSADTADMKLLYIAGNEPFNQGEVFYKDQCQRAATQNIHINTIYCGAFDEGAKNFWEAPATITDGEYMSFNHNQKATHINTPQDKDLIALNKQINQTFQSYKTDNNKDIQQFYRLDSVAIADNVSTLLQRMYVKTELPHLFQKWDRTSYFDLHQTLPFTQKAIGQTVHEALLQTTTTALTERQHLHQKLHSIDSIRTVYLLKKAGKRTKQTHKNLYDILSSIFSQAAKDYDFYLN